MPAGATIGVMSEPDAVPLPREGEVFFDVRGEARSMRLSWYADSAVAVFSIWQGNRCTATFRLPFGDLARMVDTLQSGPPTHAAHSSSGHSPERSFETGRSDPGYGYPEQPVYGPAAYGEKPGYDSRRGYETEPGYTRGYQSGRGYEPEPHYGIEPNYQSAAAYGSGQDYGSEEQYWAGQDYRTPHSYRPGHGFGGEPAYGRYSGHEGVTVRQYRDYDHAHSAADQESTGAGYGRPGYREAQRSLDDLPSSQSDAAPYLAAPAYETDDSDPAATPPYGSDTGRPATPYAQSHRGEAGMSAYAGAHPGDAHPGDTGHVRFPSASVTTEHAEPDWNPATAAYRDR